MYDTGGDQGISGLAIAEYFGLKPRLIDTTYVGGSSFEFHANHALSMIAAGKCNVALLTYGATAHSDRRAIGTAGATSAGPSTFVNNMEDPWGLTLIGNYAMVKNRHMHQYGTTNEQFAHISVATRRHAMRNPEAVKAMTDLQFVGVREITVADVMESRIIAHPAALAGMLHGVRRRRRRGDSVSGSGPNARKKPVWIIGTGEATKYRENGGDITVSAGAQAAPAAFGEAGVTPAEIDVLMAYDSFSITVMCMIEDLGFCAKGEGGAYVSEGHLAFDDPRKPTINTDGGGLSSNHPGQRAFSC